MPTTQDIEAGNAPAGVGGPTDTVPPPPQVTFQPPPGDTQFLGGSVSDLPGYVDPNAGRVLAPYQVEDRNSWYRAITAPPPPPPPDLGIQSPGPSPDQMNIPGALPIPPPNVNNSADVQAPTSPTPPPFSMGIPNAGLMPQPEQPTLFSAIGNLPVSDQAKQGLYAAAPYIRQRLQAGEPFQQIVQDVTGEAKNLGDPLTNAFGAIQTGISNLPAVGLPGLGGAPGAGGSLGGYQGKTVGQSDPVTQFVEQSIPFILAGEVLPGGVAERGFSAIGGAQGAQIADAWRSGKISGPTALLQLAQVAPMMSGTILKAIGFGKALGESGMIPSERGGGPPEGAPPEGETGAAAPLEGSGGAPPPSTGLTGQGSAQQAIPTQDEWATLAQKLKEAGATDQEIAQMTGQGAPAGQPLAPRGPNPVDLEAQRQQINRSPEQAHAAVLAEGGSTTDAAAIRLATHAVDTLLGDLGPENMRPVGLLDRIGAKLRFASGDTGVQGVNRISLVAQNLKNALLRPSANPSATLEAGAYKALNGALDGLDYQGPLTNYDGLPRATKLILAYTQPDQFTGWTPELTATLDKIHEGTRYGGTFKSLDPTIAPEIPAGQRYAPQRWVKKPTSALEVPLQRGPSGEVSVARSREFPTVTDGLQAGQRLDPKYGLRDLWQLGRNETAQGISDAFLNSQVLRHYGTNDPAIAAENGLEPVSNPKAKALGGRWFVPSAVNNAVEHVFQPEGGASGALGRIAGATKSVAIAPFDTIGAVKRIQGLAPGNWANISYALLNDLTGHRLFDPSFGTELPSDMRASMMGVPQGAIGSATEGTGLSRILTKLQSPVTNLLWERALGGLRLKANEGAVALNIGERSALTEGGMQRQLAEGQMTGSTTGGGQQAVRQGRAATERRFMFSPANTRAMIQNVNLLGKALSPTANAAQRIAAAKNIAQTGLAVWGIGSLINMKFGNGKPVPLPISWDSKKGEFTYTSDWATVQGAGQHIPLLANRAFVTMLAKSATILANEGVNARQDLIPAVQSGDVSGLGPKIGELAAPAAGFILGRESPAAQAGAASLGYGFNPDTGFLSMGNLTPQQRLEAAVPFPITGRQLTSGQSPLQAITGSWPVKSPPNPVFQQPKADLATAMSQWEAQNPNADGKQWNDRFRTANAIYHAQEYAAAQKAGITTNNPDQTLQGYFQILDQMPKDAQGTPLDPSSMSEQLDQYTAQHPDLQSKLDAALGANPRPETPRMQEHYANVKTLADNGYYAQRNADFHQFAQAVHHPEWQTLQDFDQWIASKLGSNDPNVIGKSKAMTQWDSYRAKLTNRLLQTNPTMDVAAYREGYETTIHSRQAYDAYKAQYGEAPAIAKR